jgi:hypothetical protein
MKKETATVHAIHLPICRGNGTVRSFKKDDVAKGNELVVSSLLTTPHKEIADKPSQPVNSHNNSVTSQTILIL